MNLKPLKKCLIASRQQARHKVRAGNLAVTESKGPRLVELCQGVKARGSPSSLL